MRKTVVRATLIGAMLGGGLLFAGISQAQDAGLQSPDIQQERGAELIAAVGGPASTAHLIPYVSDKAAVEARDAEVAGSPSEVDDLTAPSSAVSLSGTPAHVATTNPTTARP